MASEYDSERPDQIARPIGGIAQDWNTNANPLFNNTSSKGSFAQNMSKKAKKGKKGKKGATTTTSYVMSSQTASILKNNFLK